MRHYSSLLIYLLATVLFSCQNQNETSSEETTGEIQVDASSIGKHIEMLASDDFLGRMPFTAGETKTVNYLEEQFKQLGVEPGNGDSYFQEVPLVEITGIPSPVMEISGNGTQISLRHFEDYVALTEKVVNEVQLKNSELVFAGYGIVAPEYNWNDYEGIDWEGKTAVVLVNDPGFESGDSTLFKGNAMTYYGRWTYKYRKQADRVRQESWLYMTQNLPAMDGM